MARKIDTEAVINWERLAQQSSNPASPAAGYWYLFIKSDGLYLKDSGGNVLGPIRGMALDTIWDAAGDIVQGTGANTGARLAIGTAGQSLRVNAGATALEYVSGGRVLIQEQTPTGTGTLSWASIAATYKDLEIEYVARGTNATDFVGISIYLNNDTTATNYRKSYTSVAANGTTNATGGNDSGYGNISGANSPAGSAGAGIIRIIGYAGTTFRKVIHITDGFRRDDSSNYMYYEASAIEWESTVAINRVDLTLSAGNYDTGSKFRLYGMY